MTEIGAQRSSAATRSARRTTITRMHRDHTGEQNSPDT
jgi:hypothetical protein